MKLSEKLYKLRKEKGLSQEALAEKLHTTRQAISKWENDQGYPETENLLLLSNIFDVSIDFLLRDALDTEEKSEKGYCVSEEMARGYIAHEKRMGKYLGLCFLFWTFAGIPYAMLSPDTSARFLGIAACVMFGIVFAVLGMLKEQEEYKVLEEEPLLLDYVVFNRLSEEYIALKKRQQMLLAPCIILFVGGLLIVALTIKGYIEWTQYHAIAFLGLGIGLFGFVRCMSTRDAYELLVKNEQYCSRFLFKLKKKLKERFDHW